VVHGVQIQASTPNGRRGWQQQEQQQQSQQHQGGASGASGGTSENARTRRRRRRAEERAASADAVGAKKSCSHEENLVQAQPSTSGGGVAGAYPAFTGCAPLAVSAVGAQNAHAESVSAEKCGNAAQDAHMLQVGEHEEQQQQQPAATTPPRDKRGAPSTPCTGSDRESPEVRKPPQKRAHACPAQHETHVATCETTHALPTPVGTASGAPLQKTTPTECRSGSQSTDMPQHVGVNRSGSHSTSMSPLGVNIASDKANCRYCGMRGIVKQIHPGYTVHVTLYCDTCYFSPGVKWEWIVREHNSRFGNFIHIPA
jgi:hypothetical protein